MMNGSAARSSPNEFTADCILPKRIVNLESVVLNKHGRLEVVINNQTLEYPIEWLRHNCQCDECFNHDCLSFKFIMSAVVSSKIGLKSFSKTEKGVRCIFIDDHTVEFSTEWLYNRRMTSEGSKERAEHLFVHKIVPWPNTDKLQIQRSTYQEVTETNAGLAALSTALIRDGIFIITGAPDRDVHKEFGDKTGMFPLATHYGENLKILSLRTPISFSYTSTPLDLHVDVPHLTYYPSIQLLHCLKQSKIGGENILTDGIKAALVLRERYPEYYKILTTTKVQHEDVIAHADQLQYYMAGCNPIIVLGKDGEPRYIRLSGSSHSSFFPGTPEEYENFAKALNEFYKILYEGVIELKSSEGDIIVFDNHRLMHGRRGFPSTEDRLLECWFIDWDTVYSSYRISQIKSAKANGVKTESTNNGFLQF